MTSVPQFPELSHADAVAMAKTGWWKECDAVSIANFQLRQPRLCMDFSDFHKAVEESLGRPVWTHEFAIEGHLENELARRVEGAAPATPDILGTFLAATGAQP